MRGVEDALFGVAVPWFNHSIKLNGKPRGGAPRKRFLARLVRRAIALFTLSVFLAGLSLAVPAASCVHRLVNPLFSKRIR